MARISEAKSGVKGLWALLRGCVIDIGKIVLIVLNVKQRHKGSKGDQQLGGGNKRGGCVEKSIGMGSAAPSPLQA